MVKLTDRKIHYIVSAMTEGRGKTRKIAELCSVSQRRVQQLTKRYLETGEVPKLNQSRRPKIELTSKEKKIIDKVWEETRRGSRLIWFELRRRGHKIAKNKIHQYLRETKRTIPNLRKQKKRTRCRYEREHTGSLVHVDWHRTTRQHDPTIAIIDDSSRKVLAGGEFKEATGENSAKVLKRAIKHCGRYYLQIKQLNCDNDLRFVNTLGEKETVFMKVLATHKIKLVRSRVSNPQTNGKLERFWYEYDKHRYRFNTFREFRNWYNNLIHGELDPHNFLTPEEAFIRRMPPENILGMFSRLVKW